MRQIDSARLIQITAQPDPPCISLYMPTHRHHPENQQDPIRFRNSLKQLEQSLKEQHKSGEIRELLEPYEKLSHDSLFWNHRTESLAILSSPENFEIFELQRPTPQRLVVADSFHIKPLFRILQSADRYQLLCLNRRSAWLYEGNRDALDRIDIHPLDDSLDAHLAGELSDARELIDVKDNCYYSTEHVPTSKTDDAKSDQLRFFRTVDRVVESLHSRPSGLPLILASLPEYHTIFRESSRNRQLAARGITTNPESLDSEALRKLAWETLRPLYLERLESLIDRFETSRGRQLGSADLADVARAAIAGRVGLLLVDADRVIPGRIDPETGAIDDRDIDSPDTDDMLDDLAEIVTRMGGEVVIVPGEGMPTDSGLAAAYRH